MRVGNKTGYKCLIVNYRSLSWFQDLLDKKSSWCQNCGKFNGKMNVYLSGFFFGLFNPLPDDKF